MSNLRVLKLGKQENGEVQAEREKEGKTRLKLQFFSRFECAATFLGMYNSITTSLKFGFELGLGVCMS